MPPESELAQDPQDRAPEPMIPKARLDEVLARAQKAETALEKQQKAEQARLEAEAQQRGEWEKLATEREQRASTAETERDGYKEKAEAYEAEMQRHIAARKKALPDDLRGLMPDGDALTQFAWLDKAEASFKARHPVTLGTPTGPRGTGQVARTDTDSSAYQQALATKRQQLRGS